MISEKTVELNLTSELLNWLFSVTGQVHTAIGPSLRLEGRLGFDVGYHGAVGAILIQYKRAYVTGTRWTWNLNRTVRRDQHRRLQFLESRGIPVFYALPHFHTISQVVGLRRQLLIATHWYPPSLINPPGGPNGHHEVHFDASTSRWWATSNEEIELRPPLGVSALADALRSVRDADFPDRLFALLNEVFLEYDDVVASEGGANASASEASGTALILRTEDLH